jgi:hypothetical protein
MTTEANDQDIANVAAAMHAAHSASSKGEEPNSSVTVMLSAFNKHSDTVPIFSKNRSRQ